MTMETYIYIYIYMQDVVQTSLEQKTNIEIFVGFSINGRIVIIDPEEGNESGIYNTQTLVLEVL